jgi:hypothetical protein
MQDIKCYVDGNHEGTVFQVRVEAPNLPDYVVLNISDWALSREMGIDMEDLDSSAWDVSRPEEDDMGVWYIDYSIEA